MKIVKKKNTKKKKCTAHESLVLTHRKSGDDPKKIVRCAKKSRHGGVHDDMVGHTWDRHPQVHANNPYPPMPGYGFGGGMG